MLTPQQNLEEADEILGKVQEQVMNSGPYTIDIEGATAVAVARIQLAQALHVVQLAENINDTFEDLRESRKLT
jgi:hypothetical protein